MRIGFLLLLLMLACPTAAAPELTQGQREILEDSTTDRDDGLDSQRGFKELLKNAAKWDNDDFSGDEGEDTAPDADYESIREAPAEARGEVFLIEGWLAQADRYPGSGKVLQGVFEPHLGEQVTRWVVVTERENADSTIIVLFHDPRGLIEQPKKDSRVKIAARFYKLWTTQDATGDPFTFVVFVGGAAEDLGGGSSAGEEGGPSIRTIMIIALVTVAGGFYIVRFLLNKKTGGGGRLKQRLEEIRHDRERLEAESESEGDDEEDEADDLPEDPVAALDELNKRHAEHDQ